MFVKQTDAMRYGELKKTIINDYLRGGPDCPKTLEAAITLFKNYQPTTTERLIVLEMGDGCLKGLRAVRAAAEIVIDDRLF